MPVAVEHLDVGQQMMRKIDRLRALQMRVTRNDDADVVLAQLHERVLKRANFLKQLSELIPQPQANVRCNLVVARTASMNFRPGGNTADGLNFGSQTTDDRFV